MKFTVSRTELLAPLHYLAKAAARSTSLPGGILITVNENKVTLVSGDSHQWIRYELRQVQCTMKGSGSAVLSAETFYEIVKKMNTELVELEHQSEDSTVTITSPTHHFLFVCTCLQLEYLNEYKLEGDGAEVVMEGSRLKEIVNQTVYATSAKEDNSVLSGLRFSLVEGKLSVVGCDRYRLAKASDYKTQLNREIKSVMIPAKSIIELKRIIKDHLPVLLRFVNQRLIFMQGAFAYSLTSLEGQYPPVESMISKSWAAVAILQTKALLSGLERALVISEGRKESPIHIHVNIKEDQFRFSCHSEKGYLEEQIQLEKAVHTSFELNINAKYAYEAIKTIETGLTVIRYTPHQKMVIFQPDKEEAALHLIMGTLK
ncbi:DNA polymerase III subunit beta [Neobacillus mesonae]|nr:DNA polymerase III subunit beta [Neobacillus mesonae]